MAKKSYYVVLGLKKGKTPEVLGTFTTRPQANWHIKNTFSGFNYDRFITRKTDKKGKNFVQDDVANDKSLYVKAVSTMEITNLDEVKTKTTRGTLLEFITKGVIKNKTGLGKITLLDTEESKKLEDLSKSVQVVYSEEEPFPLSKVEKRLEDVLIGELSGESYENESEENGEYVDEEQGESSKKTVKKGKKSIEKGKKDEETDVDEEDEKGEEQGEHEGEEDVSEDRGETEELNEGDEEVVEEELEEVDENFEEVVEEDLEEVEGEIEEIDEEEFKELEEEDVIEIDDEDFEDIEEEVDSILEE